MLEMVKGFESSKEGFKSLRLNFKTSGFRQKGFESSKEGFELLKDILAIGKRDLNREGNFSIYKPSRKGIRITKQEIRIT